MTRTTKLFLGIVALVGIIGLTSLTKYEAVDQKEMPEIEAKLSGAAFVTTDLEASVKFYTNFLNFREMKRITIDTPVGLAPWGVAPGNKLEYVAMVPSAFSKESPNFPGLNFVQISDAKKNPFKKDTKRTPVFGEVMKAYSVKGLLKIDEKMRAAGVPIITPYALSSTGRSHTLTVLDPNGIRVQMYEFVKK